MDVIAVKVRIKVSDDEGVARIAITLAQYGFRVRHKMPALQMITGDIEPTKVEALRALDEVEDVEAEPGYQLPPFDKDTPQ